MTSPKVQVEKLYTRKEVLEDLEISKATLTRYLKICRKHCPNIFSSYIKIYDLRMLLLLRRIKSYFDLRFYTDRIEDIFVEASLAREAELEAEKQQKESFAEKLKNRGINV